MLCLYCFIPPFQLFLPFFEAFVEGDNKNMFVKLSMQNVATLHNKVFKNRSPLLFRRHHA